MYTIHNDHSSIIDQYITITDTLEKGNSHHRRRRRFLSPRVAADLRYDVLLIKNASPSPNRCIDTLPTDVGVFFYWNKIGRIVTIVTFIAVLLFIPRITRRLVLRVVMGTAIVEAARNREPKS